MKTFKPNRGSSFAELLMVCALTALFAMLMLALSKAGTQTYSRIAENREGISSARIGINYIDSRIKQGDVKDCISIVSNPLGNGNALKLDDATGFENESLWILEDDGTIYEFYTPHNGVPEPGYGFSVIGVKSFDIEQNGSSITILIGYMHNSEISYMRRTITPRSMIE